MRILLGLVALIGVLGLALAFTKPTGADFETRLQEQLLARIDAAEVDLNENPAGALLLATCKASRNECAALIRSLISLHYEDKVLYARARVTFGQRQSFNCFGALTRIVCREV